MYAPLVGFQRTSLIVADSPGVQSSQYSNPPSCKSLDHTPPSTGWLSHRVDEESPLRYTRLHHRECFDSVVPLHIYLPAADGKYLGTANIWRLTLHGPAPHGRDADLGHLREPSNRPSDFPNPIHYRTTHDECKDPVTPCGPSGLHLKPSVSCRNLVLMRAFLTCW